MVIKIGDTVLCAGQSRNNTGSPIGPANMRGTDTPGVITRDYIGAAREHPELVRCAHGSISFEVTRTFATEADAAAYMATDFWTEGAEGPLTFDATTVFEHACVNNRNHSWVGCTIMVSYTIEG